MRAGFGRFKNPNGIASTVFGNPTKLAAFSAFSTSSGGDGAGGGRGRGSSGPPKFDFVASHPGKPDSDEGFINPESSSPSSGVGRGRGKPLPSSPYLPSFNTFVASNETAQAPQSGLGRGRGGPTKQISESANEQQLQPKKPIFLVKDEATGARTVADAVSAVPRQPIGERNLPESILTVLTGSGRGQPTRRPVPQEVAKEENRHLRPRQAPDASGTRRGKDRVESSESSRAGGRPKLSREEAVKKAVGILSKPEDKRGGIGREESDRRGRRRNWEGERRRRNDWDEEGEEGGDEEDDALFVGDDADGERFAQAVGPEVMDELTEAFEEMSCRILPDPEEDEYIEALVTNLKIELEPEYLFGDFERNPDIDEKPPMPLRDALEKVKPFLMAYEGMESHEEWEEAVKQTMEKVPLMKEIVDHYCGPDRVTAKQQQAELERVAKTLPDSVPDSVKRFTDRAVLSLQSNPGWGYNRKCQLMDKLVNELSKPYK